ncbi:MAG: DUF5668 domain-containing protein [Cytophagales bacterium]|nr:DUF5668 domain-containing protein [Cytophagales bacterium]
METSRRALMGIFIVVIGVVLLLFNLRLIPYELYFLKSWQMLLVAIGVFNFLSGKKTPGIILVSVGAFFLLEEYGPYDLRDFWPVIIIIVGVAFIFRHKRAQSGGATDKSEHFFDDVNIFGGGDKQFTSKELEGGRVINIFGGSTIDLRESFPLNGGPIEIEVFTMFGGCELVVRDDWRVKIEAVSIFGGFSDERRAPDVNEDSPSIIIKGFTMFGAGELKNR